MTPVELAKVLGVTRRTIDKWRREGRGPKLVLLGRRVVRYQESDVQEWLNKNKEVATEDSEE